MTLRTPHGALLNCVRRTNPLKNISTFHDSNTRMRTYSTDYVWKICRCVMTDILIADIERGIGIFAYYLHPHCRGRMPTTFSHFSSPRRLGAPRDTVSQWARLLTISLQYISIKDRGRIGEILNSWKHKSEARISVVTDGVSCLYTLLRHVLVSNDICRLENPRFGRSRR